MKKFGLVLVIAFAVLLAVSGSAFAALTLDPAATANDGKSDYLSPATPYIPSTTIADPAANPIHSNYQANTDACAACHSAHNGVGADLLQWSSPTAACEACHDGTLDTTYDVQHGVVGNQPTATIMTYGGLFTDFDPNNLPAGVDANSWSKHQVEAVDINAAPGGATGVVVADTYGTGWGNTFECTSCHDPHSQSGNYRALNPNVNGYGDLNKQTTVQLTDSGDGLTFDSAFGAWCKGYPRSPSIYVGGTAAGNKVSTGFTINYSAGTVTFSVAPGASVYATFWPGIKVAGTVTNKLTGTETVSYGDASVAASGINSFCGACHQDYDTENVSSPAANLSGKYTEAFRHKVGMQWHGAVPGLKFATDASGSNEVTCLTCHVAHGTSDTWWKQWATESGWTGSVAGTQLELDGKSALKRLPNMSMCEACHGK